MSELVQRHLESMTPEIEEMRRIKLFSVDETRILLKKRKHFEFKVNGITKNLQDFLDYIEFEKILLRDIKIRRNKLRIPDRKAHIEFKILKRIKYLYEIAMQRFTSDFTLCLSYFKFCKDSNYNQAACLVVQTMITTFSHIPETFQVAAAWYMKKDIMQALNVLHKGLSIHLDCEQLYSEAIQLELLRLEKLTEEEIKDVWCKRIDLYLEGIFDNVKDIKFSCDILKLFGLHKYTEGPQNKIIDWLLTNHCEEEIVWDTLAQRERDGHHYPPDEDKSKFAKFCLMKCIEKYKEGIEKICDAKKPALWILYFNFLRDLKEHDSFKDFAIQKLKNAFEEAAQQIKMDEDLYVEWAQLNKDEQEVIRIIEIGLKAVPECTQLWKLRLKYTILKDDKQQFNQIFKRGVLQLKHKALPLWITALRYHSLSSDNDLINLIYKDAIKQPDEISSVIKPEYIEWLCLAKGLQTARRVYSSLAHEKPYCKELHMAMARMEEMEGDEDYQRIENIFKLACEQFGQKCVDVRINLIKFYLQYHEKFEKENSSFDLNEKISQIYKEGEELLKNNVFMLAEFKSSYDSAINSRKFLI